MTIEYKFRQYKECDMCRKAGYHHLYLDNKSTMKRLFPEVDWEEQLICEKCAQREAGKRDWLKVKRTL